MKIFDFLKSPERPATVYRVKILKPVVVAPWNGRADSKDPGTEVDVTPDIRAQLVTAGDAVTLGIVDESGQVRPLTKAAAAIADNVFTPEPFPEKWAALPDCFREAWKHAEKIRELKHAVTVARAAVDAVKVTDMDSEHEEHRMANARLRAAYDAFHAHNPEPAQRAQIACGIATSVALSETNLLRDRLERLAFDIFSARIAALELHPSKVRMLFSGSQPHTRFVQQPLALGRMRVAAGSTHYCDASLTTLAEYFFKARAYSERLRELLAEAQAEHDAAAQARDAASARVPLAKRKVAA